MLESFISFAPITDLPPLEVGHHAGLVLLSLVVAVFMSLMALQTANIARYSPNRFLHHLALGSGAVALSTGIWAAHFIGMLAFEMPAPMSYRADLTVLSLLPAFLASSLAMFILARPKFTNRQVIVSGILIGCGIGAMHYMGMAAMESPLSLSYDPVLSVFSVVLAALFAIAALRVRFRFDFKLSKQLSFYLSAVLLGLAIATMHYTGMAAAQVHGEPSASLGGVLIANHYLALALSSLCITTGGLVAALNGLIRTRMFYRSMLENKSRLQAILDTTVDAIITIDGKGKVQEFNRAAEQLFGYQAIEVVGHNVKMLMPEPFHSEHDGYLDNFHRTQETKIIGIGREVVARRKDGSTLPVRLAVGQVKSNNPDELLFVGMLSDISQRHALEKSLREEAQRAELAVQAKSNFLANMSHEIRTPMNAVIGFTDLLLNTDLDAQQREYLQTIKHSSGTLLSLINDILDTTKIEQGHMVVENAKFSLKELIEQVRSTLYLSAQNKGLYLDMEYPGDMPAYFCGDSLRVAQIVTNLVGNAIKFTEQGGVKLSVSYVDECICIEVVDTGIGMTAEQAQRIFEPFTQADSSISRRFGGSGLGTTISQQLAQAMGGEITLDSELGQGSCFTVRLPLAAVELSAEEVLEQTEQTVLLPKLKILIADDVEQNQRLLRLVLVNAGHEVVVANNGQEAVEHYKTGSFDVVLMDIHMPVVDGLQATRLIRAYEQQQGSAYTPIIALTASVMQHDRLAAQEAGMDAFAEKPLNRQQLFAQICRVVKPDEHAPLVKQNIALEKSIDWHAGVELWGSKAELARQICNLAAKAPQQYAFPSATDAHLDVEQLRFMLHSLRGVGGNLALNALATKATKLEQLLHADQQAQVLELLPKLGELLAQAGAQAQAYLDDAAQSSLSQQTPSKADSASLAQAVEQLLKQLAHNELDNQLLEKVYQGLAPEQAAQLRDAIDSFEFAAARDYLQRL